MSQNRKTLLAYYIAEDLNHKRLFRKNVSVDMDFSTNTKK